ncbi:PREDICTED: tryptophan--tRNA ligase, mitochondrial isoform X3 [Papilio xuthus]|uniref:tryptophan--tRNA ligase n=1 Tax=Papilio xuthus TaxID=66420 RepID=A0AAJ6ZGU7_PAPXU|nr:PREDICTED: tryptophan--tRNA ligase, mitochondrial isoform X3 [Papilio xuthus]
MLNEFTLFTIFNIIFYKMVLFTILCSKLTPTKMFSMKSSALFTSHMKCIYRNSNRFFSDKCKSEEKVGEAWPRRVVTGLQPTGELHLGNYFGALRRCVQLQEQGDDVMVFIADLHSFTGRQEAGELQPRTLQVAAAALAAGLCPERGVLFVQSAVARHAELCWLLACLATHARLAHLPQYKEKAAAIKEVPVGLLLYPVLQAADILVYRGTHVPVGADQAQHLQVAAQLVRTFHHRYGRAFPTPRALLPDDGSDRIRSLRDPSKKMSKSDPDPKSRILLTDSDDAIRLKIRKAVTDFTPQTEGRTVLE